MPFTVFLLLLPFLPMLLFSVAVFTGCRYYRCRLYRCRFYRESLPVTDSCVLLVDNPWQVYTLVQLAACQHTRKLRIRSLN